MTTHDTHECSCKFVHEHDGSVTVRRCATTNCPVHGVAGRAVRGTMPVDAGYRDVATVSRPVGGNDYR